MALVLEVRPQDKIELQVGAEKIVIYAKRARSTSKVRVALECPRGIDIKRIAGDLLEKSDKTK